MAIRTRQEYLASLKRQKPRVFLAGEEVEDICTHGRFLPGLNSVSITYEAAHDPLFADLSNLFSPLTGEPITRWTHIQKDEKDALVKTRLMRRLGEKLCACHYRCLTSDCLNAAWVTSFEIDRRYNTDYHRRVQNIVRRVQEEDLVIGGAIVDPKGDRRYRPAEQPDPDMYLHVVEKRADGIVVKGAKAHSTAAPYTNMLCVFPCRPMMADEKEFAVAFFTPVDAPGITYICKEPPSPGEHRVLENPISSRFGQLETFIVFDHVFVPWENVFLCGEVEFSGLMLSVFNSFHTWHKCACRAASMDTAIGALSLIADYNGTAQAPHIRGYLTDMILSAELVYAAALAAAVDGHTHESGVYIHRRIYGNAGKVFAAMKLGEERYFLQEAAGGVVTTLGSEKDYFHPVTGPYLEKYLCTRDDVAVVDRVKAIKLVEDLVASPFAGWYHGMCISGGATSQTLRERVLADYNLQGVRERALRAIDRK
ncbi:4-hydroxyphenylacetate 3-hydroxylase N-terminal domain-containing protein [Desulfofundulus thermocisternus]|uniref:4-hydroxyphenylacetate 3-hydroxylase N-terminal domain-containing protein n=1 Tax=Desulfofundulus thermocisternus TaxID=42471 RepID=UPI00217D22C6|nr:4-hydroxyphenylacetate 3-hydroxylase N-terminal domain-containing protein [Desulfofundulus thermocisternus]MCS5695053.1 hypothetical protein [Desulfofundulus thermocisternus]